MSTEYGSYSSLMSVQPPHLILTIDTKDPIEVGNFVGQFTSLANQYEKYMRSSYPDMAEDAEIFVSEVKDGSIVAHLIPHFLTTPGGILGTTAAAVGAVVYGMEKAVVLEDFVTRWGGRLAHYFGIGGRDVGATKGDLKDFHNTVAAIAADPNAIHKLEAAYFEDGKKKVKAAFKFTTPQARIAEQEIERHKHEMEQSTSADHQRALMTFVRPDIRGSESGKRSGELVISENISDKPMPLIYASALAEQRIKYEIAEDESVFKKGFVVDINVELRRGKPVAYRVTNLHQVIDLPDDEPYISSSLTPSSSYAATAANRNVAANVPRASLFLMDASVSPFRPCFPSRSANTA